MIPWISTRKEGEKLVEDKVKTTMITIKDHMEAEQMMNSHALAFSRMLRLSNGDGGRQLKNVIVAEGTGLASLYGLRKDHKPDLLDETLKVEEPKMQS